MAGIALVLGSGAVMVLTGVLAESDHWLLAAVVSLVGAALVLLGFGLAAPRGTSTALRAPRIPTLALMLLSGLLMAAAGYLAARGDWSPVPLLVLGGGVTILAAYPTASGE